MSNSDNHQAQKSDDDLAFTPEELGPRSLPPSYPNNESYEMRNMAPANPATQGPGAPEPPRDEPFNFGFFKPKQDARRKYFIALIIFLTLVIATLTALLGVLTHKRKADPVPQNITVSTTMSTALISTEMVSTTLVSTQITTQVSTLPVTSFQSTTTTETTTTTITSLLPNPTSVEKCWGVLADICDNSTTVPTDTNSGSFGDCKEVLGVFYCGLINQWSGKGIFIIPADESPICGGMEEFCNSVDNIGGLPGSGGVPR
jgi:hypothetical protein